MFKFLLVGFLLYLVYNFIFKLVMPIYKTTKQVRQQFGDMQQQMQNKFGGNQQPQQPIKPTAQPTPKIDKDYIEYEEVK